VHYNHTILFIVSVLIALGPNNSTADKIKPPDIPDKAYYLEIDKSERLLRVKYAGDTYQQFHVASGRGGPGKKQRVGDRRTPEGIYRIAQLNTSRQFHFFIGLNYPNIEDARIGFRNDVISKEEFNQIIESLKYGELPPQNTALGGAIGIHGIGLETTEKLKMHAHLDWTKGCLALTNTEISALRRYVSIGTEVIIKE
tara:strand:- start:4363 stop:4956 length:594 start_codon:yes stop_codon:yes gene_type:complete